MGIQFNPPEWLLQEYMNRKSPVEQAAEGAQKTLGTYMTLQQQQATQDLAQEDRDIKLAGLAGESGTAGMDTLNAIRKSQGRPALTIPGTASASSAPPPTAPAADPEANFSSDSGQATAVAPNGSPVISHWNSTVGQASSGGPTPPPGKPQSPEMGSDPAIQEFLQLGAKDYQAKYGTKGMAKVKQAVDIEKGLQDKTKGPIPWYDTEGNKRFETPANGKIIPGSASADTSHYIGNSEDGDPVNQDRDGTFTVNGKPYRGKIMTKNSETPTSTTRSSSEFAKNVLPHISEMRKQIAEADRLGLIGPGAGRVYGEFLAGKVGSTGNASADKVLGNLRASDSLMKSATLRVHFGARGGSQMYDHFSDILNSGKQSAAVLNGALDGIESYMQSYADAGTPGRNHDKGGGALTHLSTTELQAMRKKMTAHLDNGN